MERLSKRQLTSEEAVAFAEGESWKAMTPTNRAIFQFGQECLCMPFSAFHEGAEAMLGRSVWTHEFADPDRLWNEFLGKEPKPDMAAIIAKLPADKSVIVIQGS